MLTLPAPLEIAGNVSGGNHSDEILGRYTTSLLAEGACDNTVELRVQTVRKAARVNNVPVTGMTTDHIRDFLAGYRNANTRNTHYRSLRAFHRWLLAEGVRPDDPTAVIRRPPVPRRVPRPCTTPALEAMFAVATPRERAMLTLAAYLGFRAGDIAAVRGEQFDLHTGTVRVRGKGGVESVLPLPPDVVALAATMPSTGFWFPSRARRGAPLTANYVSIVFRAVCARAGVPLHGAHPLRHWFGTNLVRSGADLRTVQTLMRHASLATTAGYVEVCDQARRDAVGRLPRLGAVPPTAPG